jgi:hypothetical protein
VFIGARAPFKTARQKFRKSIAKFTRDAELTPQQRSGSSDDDADQSSDKGEEGRRSRNDELPRLRGKLMIEAIKLSSTQDGWLKQLTSGYTKTRFFRSKKEG